jgi:HEAT repeat protein
MDHVKSCTSTQEVVLNVGQSVLQALEEEWIHSDIAQALGKIQGEELVEPLIRAAEERNANVRKTMTAILKYYLERARIAYTDPKA